MRKLLLMALFLFSSSLAMAKVINVEFKFTPFIGDPAKEDQVKTVDGKARVFINNVLLAEQEVQAQEVPVIFEAREIAASVWVPVAGLGGRLRKGKNKIRIEFEPNDAKTPYKARLAWASVMDEETVESQPGQYQGTNQSDEGMDTKPAKGKITFEREFVADFAADFPWHHYPAITTLTDEDKQRLTTLVNDRVKAFKPKFADFYRLLEGNENIQLPVVKKIKCVEKAYAAGIRVVAATPDKIDFVTTGNAEVVIQGKGVELYTVPNPKLLDKLKGNELQMCAGMTLYLAYPPRIAVVRMPTGEWKVVY
jgi:hypothetical protein